MTALLALFMVVLAVASLAVFERKAFCRFGCPVGRTIGFYSQLAPVELRPVDADVCARCTTLECYHGTAAVEPCPTHLTMGRFAQNTYCTSCAACVLSCPWDNVAWRLRSVAAEARVGARPHWDEAWFMVVLWAITTFHGLTMIPHWGDWVQALARTVGDTGHLRVSFSFAMAATLALMVLVYFLFVALTRRLTSSAPPFRRLFAGLSFTVLPLAFSYHLTHNLGHLARESGGLGAVLSNPLGLGAVPLKPMELHARYTDLLIPEQLLFALQASVMVWGFWVAVQILRHRGLGLMGASGNPAGWRLLPMMLFVGGASAVNLLLLTQEMVMRL
jgi:ferredoxin